MAKNNVLIYTDCIEQMGYLSMEERGILFTAILHYQAGLPLPEMTKMLSLIFVPIRQQLDRDNEAYRKKCEKNRANIEARWKKSQDGIQSYTNEYERIRSDTKNTDNDNDNGTDNDKDNDNGTDNDKDNDNDTNVVVEPIQQPTTDDYKMIVDAWNAIGHVVKIDGIIPLTRRDNELRLCIGTYGMDGVINAIAKIADSPYLKNRGSIVFDHYINMNAMQRLLEGAYDTDYKAKDSKNSNTAFNNFSQRNYNFADLERRLFNK